MRVTIKEDKEKKGFFTVIPEGSIDSDTHDGFRDKIGPLLVKSTKNILLDLRHVDYISSAGLGVLFLVRKYMVENGGTLLFCNLKPQIKKLFEIVKALPKESIFDSLEQADKYFYHIMNEEIKKQRPIEE